MNAKEDIFKSRFVPLYPLLFRVAYTILGNEADAGDAVQETMMKIWNLGEEMATVGNPQAYASRVLRTTAIDLLRKRKHESEVSVDDVSVQELCFDIVDMDSVDYIRSAIAALPPGQQEVMALSAYEGLPNDEIAKVTGFTNDNVRQLLSRARKRLRTIFKTA